MATYVMSDIHGHFNLFKKMLKTIKFTSDDELYILGDVIDRGPDGIKLLLKIMETPNIHMLLGNHEYMMRKYYQFANDKRCPDNINIKNSFRDWQRNGGEPTLKQFENCTTEVQAELLHYINRLPVEKRITINDKEFILCHAQPHPSSFKNNPFKNRTIFYRYDNPEEFSVWHRYRYPDTGHYESLYGIIKDDNFKNKTIIFGHTPVYAYLDTKPNKINEVLFEDNTINIDCGCAAILHDNNSYHGRLACIKLDDMSIYYIDP